MCGSHGGEPVHVEAVRSLLRRAGVAEEELRCPLDLPRDREDAARVRDRAPIYHNCSGKHAGMLAACRAQGWPLDSYQHPDHPLQSAVLEAVRAGTGVEAPAVGVDGCGVPVHGVPLRAMALLFARLAAGEGWGRLERPIRRAVQAMRAEPHMVAGRNRLDTALGLTVGSVVSKGGAEGLACAALLDGGAGIAVKIRDGSARAAAPALLEALRQLGAVSDEELAGLEAFARPTLLGRGAPVGALVAAYELRRGS